MPHFEMYHLVIRVPKAQSAFLYFTLESNEGLGFYSTLDCPEGHPWREVDIKGSAVFLPELERLLDFLRRSFPIEVLHRSGPAAILGPTCGT